MRDPERRADSPRALNAARLAIAFGLMLLPAVAMGATLPVLVRALEAAKGDFGRVIGRLYGWNTLGAVAGDRRWLADSCGLPPIEP